MPAVITPEEFKVIQKFAKNLHKGFPNKLAHLRENPNHRNFVDLFPMRSKQLREALRAEGIPIVGAINKCTVWLVANYPEVPRCKRCGLVLTLYKGNVRSTCSAQCNAELGGLAKKQMTADEKAKMHKRRKATLRTRYGVTSTLSVPGAREKYTKTMMTNYGVANPLQSAEISDRMGRFECRAVRILGKERRCQGYEGYVLRTLEPHLAALATAKSKMPNLWYTYEGRDARYFPDARCRLHTGEQLLIEVKSTYTLAATFKRNWRKIRVAKRWCKNNGYTFVLAVSDGKEHIAWLRNPGKQLLSRIVQMKPSDLFAQFAGGLQHV